MLIGLFPLQVQWPRSVKAYPPLARWYLEWIFTEQAHFISRHIFWPVLNPHIPAKVLWQSNKDSRFQRRTAGNIKGKRRCCSCLLNCAWDDKHWEAFIWVLFSRFSSHKGEQWTGLILRKMFGALQNHKTSLRNSQSTEWEAAATVLCHFLTSNVISYGIWCSHRIAPLAMGIRYTEINAYENYFAEHAICLGSLGEAAIVQHAVVSKCF